MARILVSVIALATSFFICTLGLIVLILGGWRNDGDAPAGYCLTAALILVAGHAALWKVWQAGTATGGYRS